MDPDRPGLARVNPRQRTSVAPLVRAASSEARVMEGLADGYAQLALEHREQMIRAIIEDADLERVSSAPALAALLSVEEDVRLARVLQSELLARGTQEVSATQPARALSGGDEGRGAVVLERPLFSRFVEVLAVAWELPKRGITACHIEPLVSPDETLAARRSLPTDISLTELSFEAAVDRLCAALWRTTRAGHGLPVELRRVLDLFT